MRDMKRIVAGAIAAAFLVSSGWAAGYQQVLTFDQMIAGVTGTDQPTVLGGSINDGSTSYHVVKRSSPTQSWIVKVENFTSTPSASVLYDWGAANLNMGRALGLAGNDIVIGDGTDDTVYKVDVTTGVRTDYVTKAQILAQTGGDAIQGNSSYVTPTGELIFLETDTDALYKTNGAGVVETYISKEALQNAQGLGPTDTPSVSSQLAFDSSGKMYFGASNTDTIYAYDPSVSPITPGDNITPALTLAQITAITGETSASIYDMIYDAADDLIFFREGSSKSFMSFDPDDPAGTLTTVLTQAELEAGPAATAFTIGGFTLVGGELAWSNAAGEKGYNVIPEPTSLMLLALAVPMLVRRR